MNSTPSFLTVEQVAERLAVSTKTVHRRLKSGDLAHTKIGRSVRVSEADLRAFLADRRVDRAVVDVVQPDREDDPK